MLEGIWNEQGEKMEKVVMVGLSEESPGNNDHTREPSELSAKSEVASRVPNSEKHGAAG